MRWILLSLISCFGLAVPARAEVTNIAANGFTVKHELTVAADAKTVWAAMINPTAYWNPAHSWSGDAANLYLVAQAGGCFCELIRNSSADNIKTAQGSVQHMRVIFVQNDKMLRMSGALGPLQAEAVVGTLTMTLTASGKETLVRFEYRVGGYMEAAVGDMANGVDAVIGEQLQRLGALFTGGNAGADDSGSPADAAVDGKVDQN